MQTVLVLDDDKDYLDEIHRTLSHDGCNIFTASCPREAISICISEKPEILITDWMLKDCLDGLSVAEIMEVIQAKLKIILITGYASKDLKENASQQKVFALLEKPFSASKLKETVKSAGKVSNLHTEMLPIGILEIHKGSEITFTNDYAKKILLGSRSLPQKISNIFNLQTSHNHQSSWASVKSLLNTELTLSIKSRVIDEDRECLVFLTEENYSYMFEPIIQQLLGNKLQKQSFISTNKHLLILDDFEQIRKVAAAILKDSNWICHTAHNFEEALSLYIRDKKINHVIVDLEMDKFKTMDFIKKIRLSGRDTAIIGSCSYFCDETSHFKVDAFLPKPWSDQELLETVQHTSKNSSLTNKQTQNV